MGLVGQEVPSGDNRVPAQCVAHSDCASSGDDAVAVPGERSTANLVPALSSQRWGQKRKSIHAGSVELVRPRCGGSLKSRRGKGHG